MVRRRARSVLWRERHLGEGGREGGGGGERGKSGG